MIGTKKKQTVNKKKLTSSAWRIFREFTERITGDEAGAHRLTTFVIVGEPNVTWSTRLSYKSIC